MKLEDVMQSNVSVAKPNTTIQEAAKTMETANVGMLPVMRDGELLGVVTDRDLVIRALSKGDSITRVEQIMTGQPVAISKNASIDQAINLMEAKKIGRLVVTDDFQNLVGVVSAADIAVALAGNSAAGRLAASLAASHKAATC